VGLFRATADRSRFKNGVADGYLAPYDSWAHRTAILNFIRDIPLEQDHPTRRYFLELGERIRALNDRPVMIVWGEQDFCFVPFYRHGFVERFPNAEVHVFQDASHWVVEDAHEKIVPLMRSFLERHR
jgi:pimeloyl-ACP methyl ester carboxylesterase